MKKCEYCAKEISYHEQYCSIECHAQANKYYEKCEKYGKLFGVVNGICLFGIPIGIFMFTFLKEAGALLAFISCVVLGIMLILLPFPTENMIEKHKIKKAMKKTQIFGIILICFGVILITSMYLFVNFENFQILNIFG